MLPGYRPIAGNAVSIEAGIEHRHRVGIFAPDQSGQPVGYGLIGIDGETGSGPVGPDLQFPVLAGTTAWDCPSRCNGLIAGCLARLQGLDRAATRNSAPHQPGIPSARLACRDRETGILNGKCLCGEGRISCRRPEWAGRDDESLRIEPSCRIGLFGVAQGTEFVDVGEAPVRMPQVVRHDAVLALDVAQCPLPGPYAGEGSILYPGQTAKGVGDGPVAVIDKPGPGPGNARPDGAVLVSCRCVGAGYAATKRGEAGRLPGLRRLVRSRGTRSDAQEQQKRQEIPRFFHNATHPRVGYLTHAVSIH